jgi:AraC-like DNA-binding protein
LNHVRFRFVLGTSVKCGPGWQLSMRPWSDHRILLVRAGLGHLHHNGKVTHLSRGSIVFGLPGEIYGITQNPKKRLVVSVVRFDAQWPLGKNHKLFYFRPRLFIPCFELPILESLMLKLTHTINHPGNDAKGVSLSVLKTILWFIKSDFKETFSAKTEHIDSQNLKPALEYAPSCSEHDPSIQKLAQLCGMTPITFRRKFSRAYGRSPKSFFLERRMARAKTLLLESPYTVNAIAEELGYSETAYFSRQFRKIVGMTPVSFRTSYQ